VRTGALSPLGFIAVEGLAASEGFRLVPGGGFDVMAVRQPVTLVLALALLAGVACSKTQDTAPETRLFGSPPIIQSVDVKDDPGDAHCDITKIVQGFLCNFGILPGQYTFSPSSEVFIDVTYSETIVTAHIVDPEDTPTTSDILLATTSYLTPAVGGQVPEEISLLMFDDGKSNKFPYKQVVPGDCTISSTECGCNAGNYDLTSNDLTAGDHIFTRGFGFVTPGANVPAGFNALQMLSDCVALGNQQYPTAGSKFVGSSVPLRIEAVDHSGNLTVWPLKPAVTVGPSSLTRAATTDECAYCIFTSADPISECRGKPGLIITDTASGFPLGPFCQNLP
jgi:hypothetical protein